MLFIPEMRFCPHHGQTNRQGCLTSPDYPCFEHVLDMVLMSRLMELDPKYADVIIRRWQEFTGKKAVREEDGEEFDSATPS